MLGKIKIAPGQGLCLKFLEPRKYSCPSICKLLGQNPLGGRRFRVNLDGMGTTVLPLDTDDLRTSKPCRRLRLYLLRPS